MEKKSRSKPREVWDQGVYSNKRKELIRLGIPTTQGASDFNRDEWIPDVEPRLSPSGMCYLLSVIPAVVLTYLQLALNLLMVILILNTTLRFSRILSSDLDKHINVQENRLLASVVECTREYLRNRCAGGDLPPALEKGCDAWRTCMEQDTRNIMKSKETAVVLAEILNNFFGSLSDRTIYCSGGLLVGSVLLANMTLSWSRRKLHTL